MNLPAGCTFHNTLYRQLLSLLFTQDSFFSTYYTVINEGPVIEVLIIFKAPI